MGNGNGVLMGATNTKDLRQLLLPFFVNGTDRRSLQLFIALMSSVIAVSLGLSAWTIFIANGLITHFLPADLITGLSVMVILLAGLYKAAPWLCSRCCPFWRVVSLHGLFGGWTRVGVWLGCMY
jgi:hypothetical protein